MEICGVIAEYNPFHKGHAYHLQQIRDALGRDSAVICVMSGSWTQRGEPAVADKWTRAHMALVCGADVVLELPVCYAVAPAPLFARGGVRMLATAGCQSISFGCENDDLYALRQLAEQMEDEPPEVSRALQEALARGLSYPRARQMAYDGHPHAGLLRSPNNILALAYLRANRQLGNPLRPLPIKRRGAGYHDSDAAQAYPSATALRNVLRHAASDAAHTPPQIPGIPPEALAVLRRSLGPSAPVFPDMLDQLILYKLRGMDAAGIAALAYVDEGMEQRILQAAAQATGWEDLLTRLKHKRFVRTRIARILTCALLDITDEWLQAHTSPDSPLPMRLLGFRRDRGDVLSHIARHTPLLSKPADLNKLPPAARRIMEKEQQATDLHSLLSPNNSLRVAGRDATQGVVLV